MRDTMSGYVERGVMPGLVTLVSRQGDVRVDAIGTTSVWTDFWTCVYAAIDDRCSRPANGLDKKDRQARR